MSADHHLSHTHEVARLLGLQVASARRERGWTVAELAERCGVTKKTMLKVEHGDPSVRFGTAIDAAVLCGVPLYSPDRAEVAGIISRAEDRLALLTDRVRPRPVEVRDEF